MKISYILLLLGLTFNLYSCKESKKAENKQIKITMQDLNSSDERKNIDEISLAPLKNIPKFSNMEADKFVNNTKFYFEQMAEATQKEDADKVLELQLKAADIDREFRKVKVKLNPEEQQQLTGWYMQLVEAASK